MTKEIGIGFTLDLKALSGDPRYGRLVSPRRRSPSRPSRRSTRPRLPTPRPVQAAREDKDNERLSLLWAPRWFMSIMKSAS